jgi:hypothetical protein
MLHQSTGRAQSKRYKRREKAKGYPPQKHGYKSIQTDVDIHRMVDANLTDDTPTLIVLPTLITLSASISSRTLLLLSA